MTSTLQVRVMDGPDRGVSVRLDERPIRVGKSRECELCLTDPAVSRIHIIVESRGELAFFRDNGSTNGTRLNNRPASEADLSLGDVLQIGGTTLVLERREVRIPIVPRSGTAFHGLVGESRASKELFSCLAAIATTPLSVIIQAESGCGKEMVARAMHEAGPRAAGPFVVFDCACVDPALVGSQLFGHTAGAFTGATIARKGAFASASGGTLFLDEIGELPLDLQPKLLRALERREVQPLGSDAPHRIDVRLLCATHRDLTGMVSESRFRRDLYYRLAGLVIEIPPLRDRLEDVPILARHFLEAVRPGTALGPDAQAALLAHTWPGNVRELKNVVERSSMLCASSALTAADIRLDPMRPGVTSGEARVPGPLGTVDRVEAEIVRRVLKEAKGNKSEAARVLGIARKTLREKMEKYGIPDDGG